MWGIIFVMLVVGTLLNYPFFSGYFCFRSVGSLKALKEFGRTVTENKLPSRGSFISAGVSYCNCLG